MQLLIFRHGIADPLGVDGVDATRRLTAEGIQKTEQAAKGLAQIARRPDIILTSPLVRAMQTAEIVGRVFDRTPTVLQELAHGPPKLVIEQLRKRKDDVILIVGHEPTLSGIIRSLCFGRDEGNFVEMKKAGCACVETLDDPGMLGEAKLLWLATPKLLRRLAE